MTIAAAFVTAEGVVLGADSTVTLPGFSETRYYNHAQKVFEIGEKSTLGLVMWGDLPIKLSYRTMLASFGDSLARAGVASVQHAAEQWSAHCWSRIRAAYAREVELAASAGKKIGDGVQPTPDEERAKDFVDDFSTGFCIGGCMPPDREPAAFKIELELRSTEPPKPEQLRQAHLNFWGAPNILRRVLTGVDWRILNGLLDAQRPDGTKLWTGTEDDLYEIAFAHQLVVHPGIPIREAVDLVHFSIQTTIKALKFSHLSPTCGGPIEVAVITSDRPFRWVRHKTFDAAI